MTAMLDDLQRLLLDPYASGNDYRRFRGLVATFLVEASGTERARTLALSRLSNALEFWDGEREGKTTGTGDLVVLLRQVIRTYHRPLEIPRGVWQLIENRALLANLYRTRETEETVTVNAQPWQPRWLVGDTTTMDQLEYLRQHQPALGDGLLAAMTDNTYLTYRSEGQKRAVDAVSFAPAGSTIVVTLPTGGGKSLCFTLPAWFASRGGKQRGGTTLVVTPTVSLALDQQRGIEDYFPGAVAPEYKPHALTGDTPADTRSTIYRGLEEGTLPLLYTSPEALLNGTLYEMVLRAAQKGYLNWLVIDEAHIAESWGAGFRTEFQLLAAYRRKLLAVSEGQVRTLLLSATISEATERVLVELFAENDRLFKVRANQLRPEISYWFTTTETEEERQDRVREALYHLPRPAILYVTKPEQSQEWVEHLRNHGFQRLAAYSGETKDVERRSILREWDRNELDLIVATSAFGLGVDKEDVRAVLHASLPESIDRFYQEVGRGGRDGCRSVSLLVSVPKQDFKLAKAMFRAVRITPLKAWNRWKSMLWDSEGFRHRGNERIVDLNAIPSHNLEILPGETHRSWNEHILLMMQRARLVQIRDTRPEQDGQTDGSERTLKRRWLHVLIKDPDSVGDWDSFERVIEPHRSRELASLIHGLQEMWAVVQSYSQTPMPDHLGCLGYLLANVYPNAALACGGCTYDRQTGQESYSSSIRIEVDGPIVRAVEAELLGRVGREPYLQGNLNVVWEEHMMPTAKILSLLETLVSVGFAQIVVPNEIGTETAFAAKLVRLLSRHPGRRQRLFSEGILAGKDNNAWSLYSMPTVVVYPPEEQRADHIYRKARPNLVLAPCVSIVQRHLYLPSEHGRFLDRVDGIHHTIEGLNNQIVRLRDTL